MNKETALAFTVGFLAGVLSLLAQARLAHKMREWSYVEWLLTGKGECVD